MERRSARLVLRCAAQLAVALFAIPFARGDVRPPDDSSWHEVESFTSAYCVDCHNSADATAGVDFESIGFRLTPENLTTWEKAVRKLRTRQMPPSDMAQPEDAERAETLDALVGLLDRCAADEPYAGRTQTLRPLTRAEYQNAVRDLLALDVDTSAMLPGDESGNGFDNVSEGELSPMRVSRYVSAAQQIARLAVGRPLDGPAVTTVRVRPDVTQEWHVEGLPLGTRGGVLIPHFFPQDGEYEIEVRLARDRDEHVEGLSKPHELEVLLDGDRVERFTVRPPEAKEDDSGEYSLAGHEQVDRHLKTRVRVPAGPHDVGVTFLKQPTSLLETKRQPLNVHFNMYRHPRIGPAVYQVTITGPYNAGGVAETPSRQRIFIRRPTSADDEQACAREIIASLVRRASRGTATEEDLAGPMAMYLEGRAEGTFEDGIELALCSVLLHPKFLFRIERDPVGLPPGSVYLVSDVELASRLSFFLWSSIPDDELLALAEQGRLSDPEELERQTRRLLADPRSQALAENFASQWLYLRNLDSFTPDGRLFPDFDDNLRQALRRETELVFDSVLREERSALDLVQCDTTYLNERLAKHYGVPHVYGSRFRRVLLDENSRRGGLLRHGSVLAVTSYATRTSPVIRGKWILENILGTPPPPPPPNVPTLEEQTVAANLSVRERLAAHRADAACASCHNMIDPVGLALENYDALGRWRYLEQGEPVDATGGLPDGSQFTGVDGLEARLLKHPEMFVTTLAEKLLTYALGRGYDHRDAPAVRAIVRDAAAEDYRLSSLIVGLIKSTPFRMRTSK